jgi:hypothetical protein
MVRTFRELTSKKKTARRRGCDRYAQQNSYFTVAGCPGYPTPNRTDDDGNRYDPAGGEGARRFTSKSFGL